MSIRLSAGVNDQRDDHRDGEGQHVGPGQPARRTSRSAPSRKKTGSATQRGDQRRVGHRAARLRGGVAHDRGPRGEPARRRSASRSVRGVRSTSITPSSMTAMTAAARPAKSSALNVESVSVSTSAAAVSDDDEGRQGDERRAPGVEQREEHERQQRAADDHGERQVVGRLADEVGGAEGRRVDLHAGEARAHLVQRVLDAVRDGQRVGAGELLDDEQEARLAVRDRVADQRLVVLDDAWSRRPGAAACRSGPCWPSSGTRASFSGVTLGRMWRTCRRWLAVSMKPPVPGVEASRKLSGETSCALPAVRMTCWRVTLSSRRRSGSTRTWSWRSRGAEDRDVGDAVDAEQPRPDRPAGEHGGLDLRHLLRREPDHHHAALRRRAAGSSAAAARRSGSRAPA